MSTGIEWTDRTWNPVTGCTKVSPGCAHCYAETMAKRTFGSLYPGVRFTGTGLHARMEFERPRQFTDVRTHDDRLDAPLRWRKPQRVFVNSMSDLFHEDVPDAFIDKVFAVMALAPQHTFQILTKRPERMRRYLSTMTFGDSIISEPSAYARIVAAMDMPPWLPAGRSFLRVPENWPLPNVWLGVSVENQHFAHQRIPLLLQTPSAVRFISAEPLLGPVDLTALNVLQQGPDDWPRVRLNALTGHVDGPDEIHPELRLDWVIVGGESGPKARPCDVVWIRSIVEQCRAARRPAFVKQVGAHVRVSRAECLQFAMAGSWRSDGPGADYGTARPGNPKGGDPREWPEDLRVREWPEVRA